MKPALITAFIALTATAAHADVSLPALFSDHMVLQADVAAPVWGLADAGEQVSVTFGSQTQTATTDASGKWSVKLGKLKSGDTATLIVKGKNTITINDVLIGEVWLCSGQSNMAFTVGGQEKSPVSLPTFRVFTEASSGAGEPQKIGKGQWQLCSSETYKTFSGTAYFFGRNLHEQLKQPVGLIVSAVGGTPIESWTSPEAQRTLPEMKAAFAKLDATMAKYDPVAAKAQKDKQLAAFAELVAKAKAEGKPIPGPPNPKYDPRALGPGNLFMGKIAPLMPYAIRGAVWYQGESNARTPESGGLYAKQLPLLIQDWRTRWGQGDFPFAWVQLPQYHNDQFKGWCEVRESMLKTLSVPRTGMAVTIDTGHPTNIHPTNKPEVGRRLSLWALAKVYGQNIPFSGPLPKAQQFQNGAAICTFEHAEGLKARQGQIEGFELAGADRTFHPATAKLEGEKVIVTSPEVKTPIAVRYAWKDNPTANLTNAAGLPASPFRTDDW